MNTGKIGDFRNDINGLRAFAVIAVVLYHFGIPGFSGGFIGVDVFFVISGYLMTRMILVAIESDSFSLSSFYLARAKRIIPALLVVCGTLLFAGWFMPLTEFEYRQLSKHVRDSLFFISNHTYSREAGYFDSASHEKWLLHTWSLSLEWQFYLFLPWIILLLNKFHQKVNARRALIILTATSFLAGIYETHTHPEIAFYILPFRAWELLAGGLVYVFAEKIAINDRGRMQASMFGIIILFATCFFLPSSDTWPGWRALLPVVAVSLVLAMQCGTNMALANPISQWIGLRSYSIYLWHWPFVVGLGIYGLHDNWKAIGAAIGATLIIGSMSFRHIETPSRKKLSLFQAKTSWLIFAGALAVVAAPASWLKESSSLPLRSKAALTEARLADEPAFAPNWRPECFDGSQKNGCIYGNEPVGALMVGDSHASVTVTSLLRLMSKTYRGIRFWGKGACMTVLEVASGDNIEGRQCKEFNTQTFNRLKAAPAGLPIVIVNRASLYPFGLYPVETHLPGRPQARLPDILPENKDAYLADYRRRLIATACAYAETGHPVFYMLPIPEFNVNISNELARNLIRGNTPADISIPLDDYLARNNFVISALEEARAQCGIHLLDPTRYLCREGRCFGSQDGLPLFSDNNHINERGRRLISPMFNAVLVSAGMHQ